MDGSEGSPGSKLLTLCSGAERSLVLVAPFIKVRSLRRLLAGVSPGVSVTCVTRWRPEEVASGVSDLEVFDELQGRDESSLLLLPWLHGKYYRVDEHCLVGSANLTERALGWSERPNIELLLEEPSSRPDVAQFEKYVVEAACEATADIQRLVAASAAQLKAHVDPLGHGVLSREPIESDRHDEQSEQLATAGKIETLTWLPSLRRPKDLYIAYQGLADHLTMSSRIAATRDLAVIDAVPGLPHACFEAAVGIVLLQMPMVAAIDRVLVEPQRFGALRDLIASKTGASRSEASFVWQTTMRWLMHFLPSRYARRVPSHSEVFQRVAAPESL